MSSSKMFAKVVLASKHEDQSRLPLVTMHLHYPHIIHGEIMTHRVFSRNARSARAVPVKKMIEEVRSDPFIPWHWGKNQTGMQAKEECDAPVELYEYQQGPDEREDDFYDHTREEAWLKASRAAADFAKAFSEAGYHKQVANRLLEPFTWKHTLVSSTSWANFLHLRDHEDAEPHFQDLAKMVREALEGATYQTLEQGDWHLPYVTAEEKAGFDIDTLRKLSVARCARISYRPFNGDSSIDAEIKRYEDLVGSSPLHASPTEHQAMASGTTNLNGNFAPGWTQYRKMLAGEYVADRIRSWVSN